MNTQSQQAFKLLYDLLIFWVLIFGGLKVGDEGLGGGWVDEWVGR
jgi:hypothetical protein